jgi:type III restriction enzyme
MELKAFQKRVLEDIKNYVAEYKNCGSPSKAFSSFWKKKGLAVEKINNSDIHSYNNTIEDVPCVTVKVPTGGGKTFIACNSIPELVNEFKKGKSKVIAWFTPSDTILTQTLNNLKNPSHPYNQKLNSLLNNNVVVLDKEEALNGTSLNPSEVKAQTTILVLSVQSFAANNKDDRRVYQENGNLAEYDEIRTEDSNLIDGADGTSLIQVIADLNPIVIIDESHNFSPSLRVEMIKSINPCFVLQLTATPLKNSNIISFVDALELKKENMVKLPVIVYNQQNITDVIVNAINLRKSLEQRANNEYNNSKVYIRPIVLFQAQPKSSKDETTFDKIKKELIKDGVPEKQIKIKTAEINELKDIDLMSEDCEVRYIITINALKEGWDCPFAYILASLANRNSNIEVTQILGRILRLPYTRRYSDNLLNISYVLTSSADFDKTIRTVVSGLNDVGFSKSDYYSKVISENEGENTPDEPENQGNTIPFSTENEEDEAKEEPSDIDSVDSEKIQKAIGTDNEGGNADVDTMEKIAEQNSKEYDQKVERNASENNESQIELGYMGVSTIKTEYEGIANQIVLPRFSIKVQDANLFSDSQNKILLSKEYLEEGFSGELGSLDSSIDFTVNNTDIISIDTGSDTKANSGISAQKTSKEYTDEIKESLQTMSIEKQKENFVQVAVNRLDIKSIDRKSLKSYIERSIKSKNEQEIEEIVGNLNSSIDKIKEKLDQLLLGYREKMFDLLLSTNKIEINKKDLAYRFPKQAHTTDNTLIYDKGLYTIEDTDLNNLEKSMIRMFIDSDLVVFWHRNQSRKEFYINGFVNHYPDFIAYLSTGDILLVETKGKPFARPEYVKLGTKWQDLSGTKYHYFMVFESDPISGAYSLDDFKKILEGFSK